MMTTSVRECEKMTEATTQEQFVTIVQDKELDLLAVQFSQNLIIADDLFQEVAAFLQIYDQDSDYKIVISRVEFIEFIKKESILPILTRAVEELQLEFVQFAWNYILRVVDQELSPIYQGIQRLALEGRLTSDQEQEELQILKKITEEVIKRKCLWDICLYSIERANEYEQEQRQLEEKKE